MVGKTILRNFAAGGACLALGVLIDYLYINSPYVELQYLFVIPMSFLYLPLVPFIFWLGNRHLFPASPDRVVYQVAVALAASVVFAVIGGAILYDLHFRMGGRL